MVPQIRRDQSILASLCRLGVGLRLDGAQGRSPGSGCRAPQADAELHRRPLGPCRILEQPRISRSIPAHHRRVTQGRIAGEIARSERTPVAVFDEEKGGGVKWASCAGPLLGTFRTSRDVRLESVMRSKAD